ncbi:uncharacterized protein LOC131677426 [Topomyia yanbarensis]|uniref:uncharacterized protein LOC131677426 n=1 Tax=Topomyia yanbarensis TaxID=2498891 RepID=UPI00273CB202|nr:uncharacterized protein LOC131677426 [Topomyia yanbarensis]
MASSSSWYPQQQQQQEKTPPNCSQAGQRFCRLCLSKEQQLKPLFPPDGLPDEALLRRILNCLTISLSFDEDYDSFICRICIQEVTKFFFYKEQCLTNDSILRGRRKPDKVVFYGDGDLVETEAADDQSECEEEFDGDPIDSDEFDIREDQIDNGFDEGNEDDDSRDDQDDEPLNEMLSSTLKPLPKQRARRDNVQDYYHGGFRYTCATSRANGKVHWRCMYKSKLKCRAAILVASDGTVTRGPNRHNHHSDNKPALPQPATGAIVDTHTGRKVTYRLITSDRSRINHMQIICDGYKFRYARTTLKQTTYWRCMKHNGKENCKAVLSFRMDFSSCSSNGHLHNHPAQYSMDDGSLEVDRIPLEVPPVEMPMTIDEFPTKPQLMICTNGNGKMSKSSQNQKGRWNVMLHNGYEFGFPRADRMNMRWACYKKSSFNCPANLYTNRGGRVVKESEWAHNHAPGDDYEKNAIIEGYMLDAKTNEQIAYKLIPGKRGQRFVVHNGYRYSSDRLISDGRIAWKCTKCKVFVVIAGRFVTIEDRGAEHEHDQDESDSFLGYQEEITQDDLSQPVALDVKKEQLGKDDDDGNGADDENEENDCDNGDETFEAAEEMFIIP